MRKTPFQGLGIAVIIAIYLALGVTYAARTPRWEAPDEPAHFNYVKYIAERGSLPILRQGDYDQEYLERLKTSKFPAFMPIDTLRYEFHQPPLYYALAAPIYLATRSLSLDNQVLSLRLFSLAWGSLLLILTWAVTKKIFPGDNLMALAIPSFIAFLPQHIATNAAINNDTLAEVILVAILWLLVKLLKGETGHRLTIALGVLLGLALLAKTTIYLALILVLFTFFWVYRRWKAQSHFRTVSLAVVLMIAILLSGWWFGRNMAVYGVSDPFGLQRHNEVVVGQPITTWDWASARHFSITTFKSFWVQLGWMGIPADGRIYAVLALLSTTAALGFLLYLGRALASKNTLSPLVKFSLVLLGLSLFLTMLAMVGYNLRFIQAQGRYLFPALLPLATFFTLGLRELFPKRTSWFFVLLYGWMIGLNVYVINSLIPWLT